MRELVASLVVGAPFVVGAAVVGDVTDREEGQEVWSYQDPDIVESSGLVVDDRHVVTVNDSGSGSRIYTVDLATGETVGETRWDRDARDTEALAPAGPGHVWVGDIGDNSRARETVLLTRVPYGPGKERVDGEEMRLRYPDGPVDAEALLAHPRTGELLVVTKGVTGGEVYAVPVGAQTGDEPGDGAREVELRKVGTAMPMVTDGAFLPDGQHLLLRNYGSAGLYTWPGLEQVGTFLLPRQQQGEGLAVAPDGRVYLSSEGVHSALLRLDLPPDLLAPEATPTPPPSPTTPPTGSMETGEPEEPGLKDADLWPWLLGGLLGVGAVVVLLRSLRPR